MTTDPAKTIFITGATGLVGSHAAEEALKRGHRVRVLVRPTSDTRWLDQWGVDRIVGDLEDPEALRAGAAGADWIFNCAANVGDWGTLEEFRRLNVEALRLLRGSGVRVVATALRYEFWQDERPEAFVRFGAPSWADRADRASVLSTWEGRLTDELDALKADVAAQDAGRFTEVLAGRGSISDRYARLRAMIAGSPPGAPT